ncbi:hypothetical protein F5Y10DRAFT_152233 [Nemania abortiva]|nr:hypothetical protein F5Y10DRAFT_152233 [Nemania abortiva]
MPPRRTSSKTASTNEANGDNDSPPTSTPKRTMSSYRIRRNSLISGDVSLLHDELDTPVRAYAKEQTGAEDEEVLDEIVVSGSPQNAKTKGVGLNSESAAARDPAESSRMLRRSSRASSISQSGSSALSPSGRGVIIKKQDFVVNIAADNDGKPDELSDAPTSKKRKAADFGPTKRVAVRRSRSKWDNPDEMLTDPNSPLVKANLRELLCSPKAWDILTQEEREQILAKFPDNAEILDPGTSNARPDIAALRNNNNFRHDVARYQEGLGKGFHDPEWIQQAQAAHRSRLLGFYDEFRASDFEERWDMPMLQQTQAEPEANGKDVRRASESHDASTEAKTIVSSGDMADHCREAGESPSNTQHDNPTKTSSEDQKDDANGTNDSRVGPTVNMSEAEDEKRAQPPQIETKEEPTQLEAVATRDALEPNGQKLGDHSLDAKAPSMPSLPNAMEGVEQQSEEKTEITVVQQSSVTGNLETSEGILPGTGSQATVKSTQTVEDATNKTEQPRDEKDTQGVRKAAENLPADV